MFEKIRKTMTIFLDFSKNQHILNVFILIKNCEFKKYFYEINDTLSPKYDKLTIG